MEGGFCETLRSGTKELRTQLRIEKVKALNPDIERIEFEICQIRC